MERRAFLASLAALPIGLQWACRSGSGVDVTNPLAPWHLWGGSATVEVVSGAVGPLLTVAPSQLCRIDYKRPESWRFFFWGYIVGGDTNFGAKPSWVNALFDVMVGVGRDAFDTQKDTLGTRATYNSFANFAWNVPVGTIPGQQNWNRKYLSRVPSPPYDDSNLATSSRDIELLVAESISCRVRVVFADGDPGIHIQVRVGAFFAPNVHVRPDWFATDETIPQFPGNEAGGT